MISRSQIVATFVEECRDRLANIESGLLGLEHLGTKADPELVQAVFRDAHSMKASANLLEFRNIESLTHGMENILDAFRKGRAAPTPELTALLIEALDLIFSLVEDVEQSDGRDVSAMKKRLTAAAEGLK